MTNNFITTLWITLIGMGIVFTAIIFLWGVMVVLVKYTSKKDDTLNFKPSEMEHEIRLLTAIATTVVALAQHEDNYHPHEFPLPPTAFVSPWQSVMRSKILNKRGHVR